MPEEHGVFLEKMGNRWKKDEKGISVALSHMLPKSSKD